MHIYVNNLITRTVIHQTPQWKQNPSEHLFHDVTEAYWEKQ